MKAPQSKEPRKQNSRAKRYSRGNPEDRFRFYLMLFVFGARFPRPLPSRHRRGLHAGPPWPAPHHYSTPKRSLDARLLLRARARALGPERPLCPRWAARAASDRAWARCGSGSLTAPLHSTPGRRTRGASLTRSQGSRVLSYRCLNGHGVKRDRQSLCGLLTLQAPVL
jgi:hypothetical protein